MQEQQLSLDDDTIEAPSDKVEYESFISHYEDELLYPKAFNILKTSLLIFCFYFLIKMLVFYSNLASSQSVEAEYLKHLQYIEKNQLQKIINVRTMFLNTYREIHNIGIQSFHSSYSCDDQHYFCSKTTQTNLASVYHPKYTLVQQSYKFLMKIDHPIKSIFHLSSSNEVVFYKFQNLQDLDNSQILVSYAQTMTLNSYLFENVKIEEFFYLLACGKTDIEGKICFVSEYIPRQVSGTSNLAYIFTVDQVLKGGKAKTIEQNFIQVVKEMLIYPNYDILIDQQILKTCINYYQTTQQYQSDDVFTCPSTSRFNIFMPQISYIRSSVDINPQYYLDSFSSNLYGQKLQLEYFILSNTTYYQKYQQSLFSTIHSIEITAKILAFCSLIWIMINIFSENYLKYKIHPAIMAIINFCQSVKDLKNNKEVDIDDLVQNFSVETKEYIDPFQTTAQHLKYFCWYQKWIREEKLKKKAKLLDEAIELFNSADYAPVLIYVYKKKIEISEKNIINMKKFLKIPPKIFNCPENKTLLSLQKTNSHVIHEEKQSEDENEVKNNSLLSYLLQIEKNNQKARFSSNNCLNDDNLKKVFSLSSQSSMKNSQHEIQNDLRKKETEEEQGKSLQKLQQKKTLNNISNFQKQSNYDLKFDEATPEEKNIEEIEQESYELMSLPQEKLIKRLEEEYEIINQLYDSIIKVKKAQLQKQEATEIETSVKQLYQMETQKLKYIYKRIKFKNKMKINELNAFCFSLLSFEENKTKENKERKEVLYKVNQIHKEIQVSSRNIDIEFTNFKELQDHFEIEYNLMQRASLYRIKLLKVLRFPLPYKQVQSLCESQIEEIKMEAKYLMASEFQQLSPHSDLQIMNRIRDSLFEVKSSHTQKRKMLKLMQKVLKSFPLMCSQNRQIELIHNFYNYKQKKFYFIADFTDQFDIFLPIISRIYNLMEKIDLFQIYNLSMSECLQETLYGPQLLRPKFLKQFQKKFQIIENETTKGKMKFANKGTKKMSYEKDFNKILSEIEAQDHSFSKNIVLILGGQNEMYSRTSGDLETSSIQNRQLYQVVHQQIINRMQHNYFHNILIGFNLRDYQTKQGRLKKHIKHSHDLLQIDLVNGHLKEHYQELEKFLKK